MVLVVNNGQKDKISISLFLIVPIGRENKAIRGTYLNWASWSDSKALLQT